MPRIGTVPIPLSLRIAPDAVLLFLLHSEDVIVALLLAHDREEPLLPPSPAKWISEAGGQEPRLNTPLDMLKKYETEAMGHDMGPHDWTLLCV